VVEPVLEYGILGPLRVGSGDAELSIPGGKRRALLVRLLVSANHEVPSDRLIEDLWEGGPPPGAPSTLQSHVSFVRRAVGGSSLEYSDGGYRLNVDPDALDVWQFESEVDQGNRAADAGRHSEAEQLLGRALGRWRGDPLADANRAAWALPEISRLEELRLTTIEARHDVLLAINRPEDVIASAETLFGAQQWRERLWAQLMLALYRSGRQAEALRAFGRLREELGQELGIEPSRELADLEQAILLQRPELDWTPPAQLPSTGSGPRPSIAPVGMPFPGRLRACTSVFIGREQERAALDQAFKAARSEGTPRLALIAGEPGIGKTSLAAAMAEDAHLSGAVVLYGRCDRDLGIPYQPWREAVSSLRDHASVPLQEVLAARGSILRTFGAPVLNQRSAGESPAEEADPYLLFSAVLDVIGAAAGPAGLVLVIEDLHWSDAQTVQVIRRWATQRQPAGALLIATYRDSEVAAGTHLARLLADLHREPGVTRVNLRGLSDLEVLSLMEVAAG
jgi:DNA-binding SARP family transcriptional activator